MNIRFGIVGCGYIANRHAKHILEHPKAELVAAYDIKEEKTQQFCQENNTTGCSSYEQLLASHVDIVVICTPNGTHFELSVEALNAGKHILVEKPMALSKDDCIEMIEAAENNHREIFIVKQNRFNPPIQQLKELLTQKKLGKIYLVSVNCFWNRNAAYYQDSDWKGTLDMDGGTLFTQFSHFVDILYYLFGDITDIKGEIINAGHSGLIEFEDTGAFTFRFTEGGLGSFAFTTASYDQNMEGSITVFAEKGAIKIGGKYLNTIDYQRTNGFGINDVPQSNPANNYGHYDGSMSNHDQVINNVVEVLNSREKIMASAYEGMKVVEMIEKMYLSVKEKELVA